MVARIVKSLGHSEILTVQAPNEKKDDEYRSSQGVKIVMYIKLGIMSRYC